MKYYKEGITHVVEVNPLELKISVQDKPANQITLPSFVTSTYQMLQGNGYTYPLGILMSESKLLSNNQPHKLPAGTLIIYKDGTVEVKPILDMTIEPKYTDVWFAVSGCSILPKIRMTEEGFRGKFADIGRVANRPMIGYNPTTRKVIIAVRPSTSINRGMQSMINLGCRTAITLDAGGSTVLKVDGKYKMNTSRQLYSVITWV